MNITTEIRYWYNKYFEIFRDNAPKQMVYYGGYQHGKPTGMASSLESIIAFSELVEDENAIILNAGAGASSWVLRKLFKNVICTDPNLEYLEVVKSICSLGGLSTENFTDDLYSFKKFDYCYYDYGNIERMPALYMFISLTRYKMYIDDTDTRPDCKEYRDYVYELMDARFDGKYLIEDCRQAIDEYGRWGTILTNTKA